MSRKKQPTFNWFVLGFLNGGGPCYIGRLPEEDVVAEMDQIAREAYSIPDCQRLEVRVMTLAQVESFVRRMEKCK